MTLERFLLAQKEKYEDALKEIKNSKKTSHWMWFIFPQFKGLGMSETSKFYAIQNLEETKEYLNHPVLGERLRQISNELLLLQENNAFKIFGSPDDTKLKSSMTLFSFVDNSEEKVFERVIEKFFNGEKDNKTLNLIQLN